MTRSLLAVFYLFSAAHAQTPPPDQVYTIDPKIVHAPVPIVLPEADMPNQARYRQVNGLCAVDVVVDRKGFPQNTRVVRCTNPIFAESSLNAVKRYRFKPATTVQDNKPVAVLMHIEVNYRFSRDPIRLPQPHIRLDFLIPSQPIPAEPNKAGVYTLSHAFDSPNSHPRLQSIAVAGFARAAFAFESGLGCTADITIDATGHPTDAQITTCDSDSRNLEKSALQSLLASDFAPAILNGKPVPVRASVHLVCEGFDQ